MDKMDLDGNPMVWGNPWKSRQYHHPRAETADTEMNELLTYSFAIDGFSSTGDRTDDVAVVEANSDTGTGSHNSCEPRSKVIELVLTFCWH